MTRKGGSKPERFRQRTPFPPRANWGRLSRRTTRLIKIKSREGVLLKKSLSVEIARVSGRLQLELSRAASACRGTRLELSRLAILELSFSQFYSVLLR